MKFPTAVIATGLLTLSVAACGSSGSSSSAESSDSESGTVVLRAYAGIFQDNFTKAVIEPFQAAHPNITVQYEPVKNSADNLAGLRAAKDRPNTDVAIMDISVADAANQSKIFAPLDPSVVTNLKDIDDKGVVKGNYGPAVTFDSLVMVYNDKVPSPPTTWDAMADPSLRDRVIITAPPDIQGISLMLIENAKEGADYTKDVTPGVNKIKEMAPNVQTWDPNPDVYTAVQSGTADLGIAWNARAQYYTDESAGALKVAIPNDSTVFQINTINLVEKAPNPAAAQTFINYALSPEAQAKFTETMFYAPTNTKAKPSPQALARTSADPSKIENVIDVDWVVVGQKRDEWVQLWRRDILTQQ